MKLRIKLAATPQQTARIEVPAGCTISGLQDALAASLIEQLQGLAPASISVSLNRSVVLSEDSSATLASLGVCSGDLLWVLLPQGQPEAVAAVAAPEPVNKRPCPGPTAAPTNGIGSMDVDAVLPPIQRTGPPSQPGPARDLGSVPSVSGAGQGSQGPCTAQPTQDEAPITKTRDDEAAAAAAAEEGEEEEEEEEARAQHEKLLAQHIAQAPAVLGGPLPLLRVAASVMKAMQADAPEAPSRPAHTALLLAAQAALLDAGLVPAQAPPTSCSAALPASGMCSMTYRLASDMHNTTAAMNVPQLSCAVKAVALGPHLVIHAAVEVVKHGREPQPGPVPWAPRVCSLSLDTRTEVDVSRSTEPAGLFQHAGPLWIRLQDALASWCVAELCQAGGRDPPRGLLQLPRDIRDVVLGMLQARDLAAVSGVCAELRHAAGDDRLWEPLYVAEFGRGPGPHPALAGVLGQRGYKAAYAAAWKARKDLETWQQERRRRLAWWYPHRAPIQPTNPFWPNPGLAMRPPGIIGGDYDRLPPGLVLQSGHPGGAFSGPAPLGGGQLRPGGMPGFGSAGVGQLGGRGRARGLGLPWS